MKFVWITENYRVNLDSIFSLEKRYIENDGEYIEENYVILSTGLTIKLSKDKFDKINKYIDNLIK